MYKTVNMSKYTQMITKLYNRTFSILYYASGFLDGWMRGQDIKLKDNTKY